MGFSIYFRRDTSLIILLIVFKEENRCNSAENINKHKYYVLEDLKEHI